MTAAGIRKPTAPAARHVSSAARLAWLHLRSRRAPAALTALLACGAALWASLHYHWWLGTGNAADELPMILQGCAAGIIAVTMYSPFGEPERATGRRLAFLRAALVLALCGAAIGSFALGAAAADNQQAGVYLAGGILPVVRNVLGMTGIGLIFCLVTGALIAWVGPLAFTAVSEFALIANYSWPLTWPARPPADRGGWIAAMTVFAAGLVAFTITGPRNRQSGELRLADGQSSANPRSPTSAPPTPGPGPHIFRSTTRSWSLSTHSTRFSALISGQEARRTVSLTALNCPVRGRLCPCPCPAPVPEYGAHGHRVGSGGPEPPSRNA